MLDRNHRPRQTTIGAEEAETKFSELIDRTQDGESFVVTRGGQPVARITPLASFDREKAQKAADRLRALVAEQGPPVTEEAAQRNWEELKRKLEAEDDEREAGWFSSSTPR